MTSKKTPASKNIAAESMARQSGQYQKRAEKKLEALLAAAAALMARHGYARSSIRDVARESGCSLAGMYYYFKSKEELLFRIQYHTFRSLLDEQEASLVAGGSAEAKMERLVRNHLAFFTSHKNELKVCSYELESLNAELFKEVEAIRRRYFRLTAEVVGELMGRTGKSNGDRTAVRRATGTVFGMLNWIYMWFDPKRDGSVDTLGREMIAFILGGLKASRDAPGPTPEDDAPDLAAAHGDLVAAGWEYRTTADPDRIKEQRELYAELGFDVKVLPFKADGLSAACSGCFGGDAGRLEVLFTRRPESEGKA